MYSVVIIDDEILAIQHLKRLLEECAPSLKVVAQYTDASAALLDPLLETADILFVDIMMPVMNGLEFSERLLQKNPYAKVIVLTAYRDFEYAKRAMEIGVHNYWVKHELRGDHFTVQLESVLAAVEEARRHKMGQQRQLLLDALSGKASFAGVFSNCENQAQCFLLYLLAPERVCLEQFVLPTEIRWVGSFTIHGFEVAAGCAPAWVRAEALLAALNTKLPSSVEGGLLSPFFAPADYRHPAHAALLAAIDNCVFPEKRILLADADTLPWLQYDVSVLRQLEKKVFESADHSLRLFEANELVSALSPLWSDRSLLLGNRQALDYVEKRLDEYLAAFGLALPNHSRRQTLAELKAQFYGAIGSYTKRSEKEESPSFIVRRVRAYIHKHLQDDLQLKTLTQAFNISGDYLRKIFKNEMGTTLSEYITHVRMEEARRLLQTGEFKVYEIAEKVGYHSTHYFSQSFHKAMGCYPTEYLTS